MASHGGYRVGAGRKQGAVSKKTRDVADKAMSEGITPLEVMLNAMREAYEAKDMAAAAGFAKDAAPYLHARLSAVDMTSKTDGTMRVISDKPLTDEEWLAQIDMGTTTGATRIPS